MDSSSETDKDQVPRQVLRCQMARTKTVHPCEGTMETDSTACYLEAACEGKVVARAQTRAANPHTAAREVDQTAIEEETKTTTVRQEKTPSKKKTPPATTKT